MDIQIFPTLNATEDIQRAIDMVYEAGGGTVVFNDGEYRVSSVLLRSNVTLLLKAKVIVKGSRDPEDYDLRKQLQCPEGVDYSGNAKESPVAYLGRYYIKPSRNTDPFSRWSRAIIKAYRAKNIAVIGEKGATIDGQNCYDALGEEDFRGPHFINFHECDGITLRGYTLKNSSNWGNAIFASSNILCEDITVIAGFDGVDIFSCDDVIIRNCCFHTGDDCIAGFDCCNVLVENCEFNTSCNALRIGGNHYRISKCYFHGPGRYGFRGSMSLEDKKAGKTALADNSRVNMVAVFSYYCDARYQLRKPAAHIMIEDCLIENCGELIDYGFTIPDRKWQKYAPLEDITFKRVIVKGLDKTSHLYAPTDAPLKVAFYDCKLELLEKNFAIAEHCGRIHFENVEISGVQDPVITVVDEFEKKEQSLYDLVKGEKKDD